MSGTLAYRGPGCIDGEVEGEISADDTLVIGETAVVTARVEGGSIVVAGRVTGDITARERLEIRAPAKVVGNIATPKLVVRPGAVFDGRCTMGGGGERHAESVPEGKRSHGS